MSGVVEKIKDKVEHVLHKDSHDTTHTGTHTGTHGTHTGTAAGHSTNAGPHGSNLANKADPRVDSDRDGSRNAGAANYGPGAHNTTGHTGVGGIGQTGGYGHSTNAGPHDSNLANKADPRVDSDRDGSRNAGAANYGPGAHNTTGHTGVGGIGQTGGYGHSTNAGPHDSNLANKVDPRVDSDRDGSRNAGAANYGPGAHNTTGHTGVGGAGVHTGHGHSTNAGPHDSNVLNKLDPRVDSDRDGSRNLGAASYGPGGHQQTGGLTGTTGAHQTGGYASGPHDSNLANKADPRVDSDRDGSRNLGAANYGPGGHQTGSGLTGNTGAHQAGGFASGNGPAPSTAGPHSSNLANKLDPRVDSDLDGSKTVGGNQTTGHGTTGQY